MKSPPRTACESSINVSAHERIRGWLKRVHQAEHSAPESDQQSVRDVLGRELPIFCASQLRITPRRTPEDIRRAMSDGRFAEMTPDLAGYDDDEK